MSDWMKDFVPATAEHCKGRWCLGKPGEYFRCGFCGHKFAVGDAFRWIYTNDMRGAGGNPLICRSCFDENGGVDGSRSAWRAKTEAMSDERNWWFNCR